MTKDPRWRDGNARRKERLRWQRIGAPCALCGEPIDYTLPFFYKDPDTGKQRVNLRAFVIDEIVPVAAGGDPHDPQNQQPAHVECNLTKGDKVPGAVERTPPGKIRTLYDWTS